MDCEGVRKCSNEVDEYYRQIPTVFNQTIYGPECAIELEQRREELETLGLLGKIIDEVAFLECSYIRKGYTQHNRFTYINVFVSDWNWIYLMKCFMQTALLHCFLKTAQAAFKRQRMRKENRNLNQ